MPTRLPPDDGATFIAMLELASAGGDADIIEANMPRLEAPIAQYQESFTNWRSFSTRRGSAGPSRAASEQAFAEVADQAAGAEGGVGTARVGQPISRFCPGGPWHAETLFRR